MSIMMSEVEADGFSTGLFGDLVYTLKIIILKKRYNVKMNKQLV